LKEGFEAGVSGGLGMGNDNELEGRVCLVERRKTWSLAFGDKFNRDILERGY
jgi:hypothetical protein